MATIYVSQTASNGYALGVDTNDGLSKGEPKLTVDSAFTASADGSTIKINDGIYTATTYFSVPNISMVIIPENDGQVTFLQSGAQARVLHIPVGGAGAYIGAIVIDAEGTSGGCITTDSGSTVDGLVLDGTKLRNWTNHALTSNKLINFKATGNWSAVSSVCAVRVFTLTPPASCSIKIVDGIIDIAGITNSNGFAIQLTNTAAIDVHAEIARLSIKVSNLSGTPGIIKTTGTNVNINNNYGELSGDASIGNGIQISNSARAITRCDIYNNTLDLCTDAVSGGYYGILVGSDSSTSADNSISNAVVKNNTVSGGNHGVMFGYITGAKGEGNSASTMTISHLIKGSISCTMTGMKSIYVTGQAFYIKASTNCTFSNGLSVVSDDFSGMQIYAAPQATAQAVNAGFYNINCIGNRAGRFLKVDETSTATISGCNFYADTIGSDKAFNYQGTDYTTLASLETAESTISDNTELAAGDPLLLTSGKKWWSTGARPNGFNGGPIPDYNITIGESQI